MSFVAECEQCGVIERGEFEAVGHAAEDHERQKMEQRRNHIVPNLDYATPQA